MKRFLLWISAICLLAACNSNPTARIRATIESAPDSVVVLQKLNYNRLVPVDTIKTDKAGQFDYKVKLTGNSPYFYYLYLGETPVASVVLLPSDQVTVTVPAEGPFTVEGSEESTLLKQVNEDFTAAAAKLNALVDSIDEFTPVARIKEINADLSKLYVDYKRKAIKHVVTNPKSITSAVVLFQRFSDDLPVFGQETDAILFKTVMDSLSLVYPKSEFLTALRDEVDARARNLELATRIEQASIVSFPELVMPDVDGQLRTLSDLEGQVIILSFWTVGQTEHKMFNVDLMDIYAAYHARGLEVYQVSLDIDKPTWAATVRSQGLPWINVNDGLGVQSPAVSAYNVNHVPSMFVIDRAGNLMATDVFEKDDLTALVKKLL